MPWERSLRYERWSHALDALMKTLLWGQTQVPGARVLRRFLSNLASQRAEIKYWREVDEIQLPGFATCMTSSHYPDGFSSKSPFRLRCGVPAGEAETIFHFTWREPFSWEPPLVALERDVANDSWVLMVRSGRESSQAALELDAILAQLPNQGSLMDEFDKGESLGEVYSRERGYFGAGHTLVSGE